MVLPIIGSGTIHRVSLGGSETYHPSVVPSAAGLRNAFDAGIHQSQFGATMLLDQSYSLRPINFSGGELTPYRTPGSNEPVLGFASDDWVEVGRARRYIPYGYNRIEGNLTCKVPTTRNNVVLYFRAVLGSHYGAPTPYPTVTSIVGDAFSANVGLISEEKENVDVIFGRKTVRGIHDTVALNPFRGVFNIRCHLDIIRAPTVYGGPTLGLTGQDDLSGSAPEIILQAYAVSTDPAVVGSTPIAERVVPINARAWASIHYNSGSIAAQDAIEEPWDLYETGTIGLYSYGGSLSIGSLGTPALSTTQPYDSINAFTPYGALVESGTESHVSAEVNHFRNADDGSYRKYAGWSGGVASQTYAQLASGSSNYRAFMAGIRALDERLRLVSGSRHTVPAISFIHGEIDSQAQISSQSYADDLVQLQATASADIKSITGQLRNVMLFTDQISTWQRDVLTSSVPQAQWLASHATDMISLVCPKYHLGTGTGSIYLSTDGRRMTAQGYRLLGDYHGRAMVETFLNGRRWRPLEPIQAGATGSTIVIDYHVPASTMGTVSGTTPLVIDTTAVSASVSFGPSRYGFEVIDPNPHPRYITSVTVTGSQAVLTLNAPVQQNTRVQYGMKTSFSQFAGNGFLANSNDGQSPRGNLRDTDTSIGYQSNAAIPNWAIHSDIAVSGGQAPSASIASRIDDRTWTWGYVADPAYLTGNIWNPLFGTEVLYRQTGSYTTGVSTSPLTSAQIGTGRVNQAVYLNNAVFRASGTSQFYSTSEEDILFRFIGDMQMMPSNSYIMDHGPTGTFDDNSQLSVVFTFSGSLATSFGTNDGNLTTGAIALPTTRSLGVIDIYIQKKPRVRTFTCINGVINNTFNANFRAGTYTGSLTIGGSRINMLLPASRSVVFFGCAIGSAASWWTTGSHRDDMI